MSNTPVTPDEPTPTDAAAEPPAPELEADGAGVEPAPDAEPLSAGRMLRKVGMSYADYATLPGIDEPAPDAKPVKEVPGAFEAAKGVLGQQDTDAPPVTDSVPPHGTLVISAIHTTDYRVAAVRDNEPAPEAKPFDPAEDIRLQNAAIDAMNALAVDDAEDAPPVEPTVAPAEDAPKGYVYKTALVDDMVVNRVEVLETSEDAPPVEPAKPRKVGVIARNINEADYTALLNDLTVTITCCGFSGDNFNVAYYREV